MSVNSSNDSLSSIKPRLPLNMQCLIYRPGAIIFISYSISCILLLLPLCIFILYCGLQQWWKKPSTSSAVTMSHSESFTYQIVTMELIAILGCILICFSNYNQDLNVLLVGGLMYLFIWFGETVFHVLTCVEHYLAVSHPIIYLGLKNERGVRMRNISSGCTWLFSIFATGSAMKEDIFFPVYFCFHISSIIINSFCSLSVLCVLIRPGPGEQGRNREMVDQSKQRAFYTIVTILVVLVLRFASIVAWAIFNTSRDSNCLIMISSVWVHFASSLVLPLLFLHRTGKKRENQMH